MSPRQKYSQLRDIEFVTTTITHSVGHSMALEEQAVSEEQLQALVGKMVKTKLEAAIAELSALPVN